MTTQERLTAINQAIDACHEYKRKAQAKIINLKHPDRSPHFGEYKYYKGQLVILGAWRDSLKNV